ncbi:hypothetical protein MPL3356_310127 [Mesorhizobium plurifarium]|uniref:Uncharacterized protein n=1 Tax=Mesorhizobium plurifarium TaxID=69974 RepID=A0A090FCH2_MESPL|nr:hypothetical protein MPL3356_310127 [Mesorhizobium plurifarium]CDX39323.1 hypothetical protein MPLDJ20_250067 [Mesorhizobium plurifarium]
MTRALCITEYEKQGKTAGYHKDWLNQSLKKALDAKRELVIPDYNQIKRIESDGCDPFPAGRGGLEPERRHHRRNYHGRLRCRFA